MGGKPKAAAPAKRLKPFFWNRLDGPSLTSTIWSVPYSGVVFRADGLEDNFLLDPTPVAPSQRRQSFARKLVLTVLDNARATKIGLFSWFYLPSSHGWPDLTLTAMKMNSSDIKKALLELDDVILSVRDLKNMKGHVPSLEEVSYSVRFILSDSQLLSASLIRSGTLNRSTIYRCSRKSTSTWRR
jgi:hypothetical protein